MGFCQVYDCKGLRIYNRGVDVVNDRRRPDANARQCTFQRKINNPQCQREDRDTYPRRF